MNIYQPYKQHYSWQLEDSVPFQIMAMILMIMFLLLSVCLILTSSGLQDHVSKNGVSASSISQDAFP